MKKIILKNANSCIVFKAMTLAIATFCTAEHMAYGKNHEITQKGKAFSAESITIASGDSIVFKNDDDTSHNVFSTSEGFKFNLGIQKPSTESSMKFEKTGDFEIRCAIHPKMKLKVTIK